MLRKKNLPTLEFIFWVFFLHSALISREVSGLTGQAPITQLTQKDVNEKVDFTYHSMNLMKTHENNLMDHARMISGTPDHGAYISYAPEPEALSRGRAGWIAVGSTAMMISRHCSLLYTDECAKQAMKYSLSQTSMQDFCKNLTTRCTQKEYLSAYRSITGFCNHYGREGESFSAYKRLLAAHYLDGVGTPRRAESRQSLPSARFISLNLATFENPETDDTHHTLAMLQWGQFLEQDLSRPAVSLMYHFDVPFTCCDERGFKLAPRYKHKFCSLIEVPGNDPYYYQHIVYCMNYVRSLPAVRPDCSFGPAEQLNQATHYLDGSQIYGSSLNRSNNMRDFSNGQLKMSEINNKNYLSLSSNPGRDCLYSSDDSICFTSGDPRVNFEPQMTVIHTIWAREHNRIVKELAELNGEWTSNELYEEARRIVIAEIQHITYNEWLPELLAKKYVNEMNKYKAFSEKVSPSVLNSVGNAVLRAFKSMYPNKLRIFSEDRKEMDSLTLRQHFYKPEVLSKPGIFDGLIRGLTTQASGKVDRQYSEDLINNLYNEPLQYGYDMLALDIQRGRDHGLPAYHKFRSYLGFQSAKSFNDFLDVMSADNIRDLKNVYTSANDVDLIIGGLLERPVANSLFGPTFSWLLANQLDRTRRGDRYFYTNTNQPKPFSASQLQEIKNVTFARILCDNSDDVKKMQPNVFKLISDSNQLVNCNSGDIPRMDLAAWKL